MNSEQICGKIVSLSNICSEGYMSQLVHMLTTHFLHDVHHIDIDHVILHF